MLPSFTLEAGTSKSALIARQRRRGAVRSGMDDGDEVLLLEDAGVLDGPRRRHVGARQARPVDRRPEDLAVEHAGQPDVAGELSPCR